MRVEAGEFDRDPYLLNVLNGTVDLRTGALSGAPTRGLITKLAPVRFDPDASCARWKMFLKQIFAGDIELIAYVQRVLGYCLTGSTEEQKMFVLHGSGQNGKSTLIETVRDVIGEGSTRRARPRTRSS